MTVLMLMLAGSDTSKMSHKVLIGVLPDLPTSVIDRVRPIPYPTLVPSPDSLPCSLLVRNEPQCFHQRVCRPEWLQYQRDALNGSRHYRIGSPCRNSNAAACCTEMIF